MLANHLPINRVSQLSPLCYIDKSKTCITDISATVNDVKTLVSQLNHSVTSLDDLPVSIMKQLSREYCIPPPPPRTIRDIK